MLLKRQCLLSTAIGVDMAYGAHHAWRAPKVGLMWRMGRDVPSPANWRSAERRELPQRGPMQSPGWLETDFGVF